MGKKVKTGKDRLDKYYHLAKEQGYRARSAFKLIQLSQKHDFFARCQSVLDLCAAPGGWLQVCQKNMPVASTIVGVDLVPIKPIRGVVTIQADITTQRCRSLIKKEMADHTCDLVLHDGAPNVGTSWAHDAYGQNELVLQATKLCCEVLKTGGMFVTKVFRSQDYTALLWVFQQLFRQVTATKPSSSRNVSAEIFVICVGFINPTKIDPKFFDPRHVFVNASTQDVVKHSTEKVKRGLKELVNSLSQKNRQGYSDSDLYKEAPISDYLAPNIVPAEFLVGHNKLIFDESNEMAKQLLQNPLTTEEIVNSCKDLRVLGKREYAILIKWRAKILKQMNVSQKEDSELQSEQKEELEKPELDEAEQEDQLQDQLKMLSALIAKDDLKHKRKLKEKLRIARERRERSLGVFDAVDVDDELFHLSEGKDAFEEEDQILESSGLLDAVIDSDDEDGFQNLGHNQQASSDQEDEDEKDNISQMAADMQALMESEKQQVERKEAQKEMRKVKKTRRQEVYAQWSEELRQFAETTETNCDAKRRRKEVDSDDEPDDADGAIPSADQFRIEEMNDLDESKDSQVSLKKNAQEAFNVQKERWLSQPLFKDAGIDAEALEDDKEESENEEFPPINPDVLIALPLTDKQKRQEKRRREREKELKRKGDDSDLLGDLDKQDSGFQVVPRDFGNSDEMQHLEKPSSTQEAAEALGSLLSRKRTRMDLIDGAYNRYAFDDDEAVPSWFLEEEEKFSKPELPVDKETMRQYKLKLKEISKRPIRKVLEATGRKKMRLKKRMERVRKQAESIADSAHMSEAAKTQSIRKLTRKAVGAGDKQRKSYVATRKRGGSVSLKNKKDEKGSISSKGTKVVDRRLKKDKRGAKVAQKRRKKR